MAINNQTDIEKLFRNHLDSDSKRLDRIEAKIDKLSETVVTLARVEEKVISLEKESDRTNERLDRIDGRLISVEEKSDSNNTTVGAINKVFWTALSAIAAAIAAYFFTL